MSKWCTVAIVQPDYYDSEGILEDSISVGQDVYLGPIPSWLKNKKLHKTLDLMEVDLLEEVTHIFFMKYEANSLGDHDPDWNGPEPKNRSIQDRARESIIYANLSLWLSQPSRIGFKYLMHWEHTDTKWYLRQYSEPRPLAALSHYTRVSLTKSDIECAKLLHSSIAALPRRGAVFTAIVVLWDALCESAGQKRYLFHWIALEALFGTSQGGEITYRLSQRIAFFLGSNSEERKDISKLVKRAYSLRSEVVHGMRLKKLTEEKSNTSMLNTEQRIRDSIKKILQDDKLIEVFSCKKRESYLDDLVLGG